MEYVTNDGPTPEAIIDASLLERFGWTLQELDEQDESRLFPAVGAMNIADSLRRTLGWMDRAGQGDKHAPKPSKRDMQIWADVHAAAKE